MTGGRREAEQVVAALRKARRVLIVTHDAPDGDAVGSSLALALACEQLGKDVVTACSSKVPECYLFLPTVDRFVSDHCGNIDVIVYLDCADESRTAVALPEDVELINIDHHPTNNNFGDINLVQPMAAAVGEQLFALFPLMNVNITPEIATCLYTSIATDTGSFQFANTTAAALTVCADLVRAGADPYVISEQVFGMRTRRHLALLGTALGSLRFNSDGTVAWMVITNEDTRKCEAEDQDVDGIINFSRMASGVVIGLLFKEQQNAVKVGFRGRPGVDVGMIAEKFGGGGHAGAAGCTVEGNLNTIIDQVVARCCEAVKQ